MDDMNTRLHRMAREALTREDAMEAAWHAALPFPVRREMEPRSQPKAVQPQEDLWEQLVQRLDLALARRAREGGLP